MRKVLGALCVAVVAALAVLPAAVVALPAAPAQAATAGLVASSPAAGAELAAWPDQVTLTLSGTVARGTAVIRVDGPDGAAVSTGRPTSSGRTVTQRLVARAPSGGYAVRWTVVLADGTQLAGTVPFTVGAGAEPIAQARTVAVTGNGPASGRTHPLVGAVLVGVLVVGLALGVKRMSGSFSR